MDDIVNLTAAATASATAMLDLNGATSRYFELFRPSTKLPLNLRKPENNTLER